MSLAMSEDKLETLVWALEQALPNKGPRRKHLKRTVAAIIWRMRHGTPWRVIPGELGPWWQAKQSFARWAAYGVWRRVVALVRDIIGPDLEAAFLDGTVVRAHPKAAGAAGGAPAQALGRSRGGFGTKAMAVCDRRGRALAFTLLPGQAERAQGHDQPPCGAAGRHRLDRRRSRLFLGRVPTRDRPPRCLAGGPGPSDPSRRRLRPMLVPPPASDREPVGAVQGLALPRDPLREDHGIVPGLARARRRDRLDQLNRSAIPAIDATP